ncbi:uncharacterized protein Dere_GG26452 [Drosophila erecta]|uniref:Uncharacterized protein n=1 Tax=Drosophila erecta TaxID=7220 RepID=A0A0Q5UJF0_DROER|nr:uncharacterized protein Dere_GG26452 [Drosophila erecta]
MRYVRQIVSKLHTPRSEKPANKAEEASPAAGAFHRNLVLCLCLCACIRVSLYVCACLCVWQQPLWISSTESKSNFQVARNAPVPFAGLYGVPYRCPLAQRSKRRPSRTPSAAAAPDRGDYRIQGEAAEEEEAAPSPARARVALPP